jgi:hypothetical protein
MVYREEEIEQLRAEMLAMVQEHLSPVAQRYGYSDIPLEGGIKWRPLVLVLGNYSSGKSTLINELLGARIQATGQAPTDDAFTVISGDDGASASATVEVIEERDGQFLLGDPAFPFGTLRRHGQRLSARLRFKRVNSPFLKHLALIDTPGMLDSVTECDRGYSYQEVLGDLAALADLVLVLFDPHKAGTVREAYTSLRETLPARTVDDRVLLVLNRVDECASLGDLLRVYGTLCWNLSQMTGRKDIPTIWLTWSPQAASPVTQQGFLPYVENQREALREAILAAPRRRLDHLVSFVETHAERLTHLLEGVVAYGRQRRRFRLKGWLLGVLLAVACGGGCALAAPLLLPVADALVLGAVGAGGAVAWLVIYGWIMGRMEQRFHRRGLQRMDQLTDLATAARQDSWQAVRSMLERFLQRSTGRFGLGEAIRGYRTVQRLHREGCTELRAALGALDDERDASATIRQR